MTSPVIWEGQCYMDIRYNRVGFINRKLSLKSKYIKLGILNNRIIIKGYQIIDTI